MVGFADPATLSLHQVYYRCSVHRSKGKAVGNMQHHAPCFRICHHTVFLHPGIGAFLQCLGFLMGTNAAPPGPSSP